MDLSSFTGLSLHKKILCPPPVLSICLFSLFDLAKSYSITTCALHSVQPTSGAFPNQEFGIYQNLILPIQVSLI